MKQNTRGDIMLFHLLVGIAIISGLIYGFASKPKTLVKENKEKILAQTSALATTSKRVK